MSSEPIMGARGRVLPTRSPSSFCSRPLNSASMLYLLYNKLQFFYLFISQNTWTHKRRRAEFLLPHTNIPTHPHTHTHTHTRTPAILYRQRPVENIAWIAPIHRLRTGAAPYIQTNINTQIHPQVRPHHYLHAHVTMLLVKWLRSCLELSMWKTLLKKKGKITTDTSPPQALLWHYKSA